MSLNVDKLIKIMRLSTSEADGEALSALRKANSMLKEAKLDWNDIISKYLRPVEKQSGFGGWHGGSDPFEEAIRRSQANAKKEASQNPESDQYWQNDNAKFWRDPRNEKPGYEKNARDAADNLRRATAYADSENLRQRKKEAQENDQRRRNTDKKREEDNFKRKMDEADPIVKFQNMIAMPDFQQMLREKDNAFCKSVLGFYQQTGKVTKPQVDIVSGIFEDWKRQKQNW